MMNKMMKKLAVLFTVGALSVAGAAVSVSANDGTGIEAMQGVSVTEYKATKYVSPAVGANVRTAPNTEARILKALPYNTKINVTGKTNNGWVEIITSDPVNGGETAGYISASLLSDSKGADISNNGDVNPNYSWIKETHSAHSSQVKNQRGWMSHDNDTFTANVSSGYLALRSNPVTDPSNEIAHLKNGTMVHVKSYGDQFDYVYVPSIDAYGYVNNDYLAG